jgi:DNA-binding response OmpR family regulator
MDVAIRLADEGVPLCVIARATQIPSADLRVHLEAAQEEGRLLELPENDWPPYNTRSRRTVAEDRGAQAVALRTITGATRAEAGLLQALVTSSSICRHGYKSPGAIDVHIHYLRRRLAPLGIVIVSVHGHGYRLKSEDRARLLVMIERARSTS